MLFVIRYKKIEAVEFGWLFSYLYMFQTSTLKRLKEPLILMILIAWNLGYLRCLLLSQYQVFPPPPPPQLPTTTSLPFTEKEKAVFKVSVLSWVVYSSKIINELIIVSIIEKIATDLDSKHFKQIWASF